MPGTFRVLHHLDLQSRRLSSLNDQSSDVLTAVLSEFHFFLGHWQERVQFGGNWPGTLAAKEEFHEPAGGALDQQETYAIHTSVERHAGVGHLHDILERLATAVEAGYDR